MLPGKASNSAMKRKLLSPSITSSAQQAEPVAGVSTPATGVFLAPDRAQRIEEKLDRLLALLTIPNRQCKEPDAQQYREAIAALAQGDSKPLDDYIRAGGNLEADI